MCMYVIHDLLVLFFYFPSNSRFMISLSFVAVVSCNLLNFTNSQYIFNEGNMYNQTVVVECLPGYIPTGTTSLTCEINGEWNNDLPECVEGIVLIIATKSMNSAFHYPFKCHIQCNYVVQISDA